MLGFRFDPERIPEELPTIKGLSLDGEYIRTARTIRVEDAVDAFPGPVLLIHGDRDDTVPCADSVRAAGRYRRCRLEVIPGETHHFDQVPERMKTVIRDWLTEIREGL